MNKQQLNAYIFDTYGISPDYPFDNDLETAVYRHRLNQKWFGLVMTIKKCKLGLPGDGYIDVINVKCHRDIIDAMWQEPGIFPAYHMSKAHWLTIALDGSADDGTLTWLLGMSYDLTLGKKRGK